MASSLVTLAARHGLRMESVPADGDCFVTSFARVLEVIEGRAWTGAQVREGIAGALREDLLLVPDERRLWPALEPVVLQHTAESMLGRVNEAVAAVVSWQERVNRAVAGLLQSGGVTDTHRRAFAELIGQPRQWMSSAGDAMPQIATLLWNVQIQVTQVAVPAWGGLRRAHGCPGSRSGTGNESSTWCAVSRSRLVADRPANTGRRPSSIRGSSRR